MRALPFLLGSTSLAFAVVVAACSSGNADAPATADDAGPDAHPIGDPGPPDAAALDPKDAAPDAPVSGPTLALPAAADALASAQCDFLERCFAEYTNAYTGSLAGCTSGEATELRGNYPASALFDQAAVDATVSCFKKASCNDLYGNFADTKCPLPKTVNGSPVGAPCNKKNDCASLYCTGQSSTACGTCAATVAVKLGDVCSDTKLCPAGAVCRGKCTLEQGPGDACDSDLTVAPGAMVCGESLKCIAGKCEKSGGPGAACTNQSGCDVYQLQVCDTAAGHCTSMQFLTAGAACATNDDAHMCGMGMRCITPAGSTSGTCQTAIQPGQACVRSSSCTFGYDCIANVCTAHGSNRPICK